MPVPLFPALDLQGNTLSEHCVFCSIVNGAEPASIVFEDALTMAFIDLRQFNAGHTLVVPRAHIPDIRDLDDATGAALMATTARIARAVSSAFPNDGLSLWQSVGPAAFQEVPHLHFHVHPRLPGDGVLDVYPSAPPTPDRQDLEGYAIRLRQQLRLTAR